MAATLTQLAAYDSLDEGHKRTQKQMILDLFAGDPSVVLTREDIAAQTNLKLSSVCGRVFELLSSEVLAVRGTRKCVATGLDHELVGLPSPF